LLSLETPFLLASKLFLPLGIIPVADLKGEVKGGDAVYQAIFVSESLLGHVDGLGDQHGECQAHTQHEAKQKHRNVGEVHVVGYPTQAARESYILEVGKSVVNEGQQQRTEHEVRQVDRHLRNRLGGCLSKFKCNASNEETADDGRVDGVALEDNAHLGLRFVALLVRVLIEEVFKLNLLCEGFTEHL
jgi:hypothetical protein